MKHQIIIILAVTLVACSSSDREIDPEPVGWPARDVVERLVPQFHELAVQRVDAFIVRHALRTRLTEEAERSWSARLDGGIKYADLLLEQYEANDFGLWFGTPTGLTDRADGVISRVTRSEDDALDSSAYHLEVIAETDSRLRSAEPVDAPVFDLTGDEAELAVEWLETRPDLDSSTAARSLVDAMFGFSGEAAISPRLADLAQLRQEQTRPRAASMAELEVRVADAALRFARDMKHFNYRRLSWRELEDAGGGKAVVYERLRATLDDVSSATAAADVDAVLVNLRPPFVQYDRLLGALAQYREMSSWAEVPVGTTGPALRERLAAEGFVAEDIDEAIAAYQRAHQFEVGPPTAGFWRSLNVSRDDRIRQIELTLQRYRETHYRDEPDYIFVNIPDFHVDVYREGELRMRKRVVVGNTERVCDADSNRWVYPNATPIQWAMLDHLELNPWWNVPPRLFAEEIEPRAGDEEWLASKGYELFEHNGSTTARQRPGENNALGRVKFIFPNPHNTYLHDTPHKQYFARTVRTYSHGCVRLEDPLELASYLMTEYDHGGQERLDRIMELGSTIRVEFEEEIPVFFEYYTVQVDSSGQTMFLADPYELDARRLNPDDERLDCLPVVAETEAPTTDVEGSTASEDAPDDVGP